MTEEVKVSQVVRERLQKNNVRFYANDNISEHISELSYMKYKTNLHISSKVC